MRRFVLVLVVVFASIVCADASADASNWLRPVAGPVVRPFDPPATRYGPGHVGVDFAAAPGTPVRAAGAGRVVFAGQVGGALHVVISHDNGNLATSYSFLASIRVRVRGRVRAGEVIGTTGGRGDGHDGRVLHFGLRIDGRYVDPMQLFAGDDLVSRVHLAPLRPRAAPPGPPPCGGWFDGPCRWLQLRNYAKRPG